MLKDPSHAQLKVLITAGASGIGLVMARGFMQAGARVFVCDVNGAALAQAQHELPGLQGCVADVANEASVQSLLRQSRQAAIVNMSSAAGHLGMPGRSAYSASKWAVIGLTKSLAIELGKEGIRVNAVLPGAVDGPRIRAVIEAKAKIMGKSLASVTADYENQSALGRMVTPEDVADTVLFASSAAARSITGQALAVDGHTQSLS